jgi:hypothetical protein
MVRSLLAGNAVKSQLCPPSGDAEAGDDFSDCILFSIGAWDHVPWPGNDDFGGSRCTDSGVSVSQVEPLAFRCEFVPCGEPCGLLAFPVGEHVLDQCPAVGAHAAARDLPLIEQLGGEGPGHSRQLRRFPWRNLFLATQDRHGAACGKVFHQFGDESQREGRQ